MSGMYDLKKKEEDRLKEKQAEGKSLSKVGHCANSKYEISALDKTQVLFTHLPVLWARLKAARGFNSGKIQTDALWDLLVM